MRRVIRNKLSSWIGPRVVFPSPNRGTSLLELIITLAILAILAGAAMPLAANAVKSRRETELRRALRELRGAIDRYKEYNDRFSGQTIPIELRTPSGYPKKLEVLGKGFVPVGRVDGKKVFFLRRIPVDPMTGQSDWAIRSSTDEPGSSNSGNDEDVFDVYSKSDGTALDGTKYQTW